MIDTLFKNEKLYYINFIKLASEKFSLQNKISNASIQAYR